MYAMYCALVLICRQNIANAQKEIDRLEAEATAADAKAGASDNARKPAIDNQGVNGNANAGAELSQEKDGADDAADDLKKAKIEDDAAPESSA